MVLNSHSNFATFDSFEHNPGLKVIINCQINGENLICLEPVSKIGF